MLGFTHGQRVIDDRSDCEPRHTSSRGCRFSATKGGGETRFLSGQCLLPRCSLVMFLLGKLLRVMIREVAAIRLSILDPERNNLTQGCAGSGSIH